MIKFGKGCAMRNEKGITLISLVASIMLIFIIVGITITTSVNSFNQMKFQQKLKLRKYKN